ncbi:IS21-like element helper ATPase IstB [Solibacillus merdavium]|uniref:ATP-binding protein n=1 Tax=Solibacillus merdavium TaxID=2762218 RepID=A0ABR8XSW5_9BACL|nr:IS21-like element helper ATPase IstB [Solibacillus merdavium]MBD8035038.1 ATP-binding protein [Solibacillus merdavium]
MNEDILTLCKQLRLAYVAEAIKEVPFTEPEEYLYQVLLKEQLGREQAKIARNLKQARFIDTKTLESYQWHKDICFPSHLTKDELEQLDFIRRKENVILVGAPGTGKTHLASALGRKACEHGFEVRFYRVSHLVEELEQALNTGKLKQFRSKLEKVDLMILDEMGYLPFGKEGAELLFQIISEFYEQKSLIITSNLEFSQWNRIFSDSRLTAALVDRLIHHAHIISYTGQSFRLTNALSRK